MRILHILDHSAPLHSGYTFRTLSLMREQRRIGWEPLLLTGPKQGSGTTLEETVDDWTFFRTPDVAGAAMRVPVLGELVQMRALAKRIREVVDQTEPAIIHAHSPVLNGLPALRVARRCGLPLVYEVRAFWEDAAVEHGTHREGDARYRATRAAESFVLKRADAVATICDGLRKEIIGRGVAADRVTVIANAVDVDQFAVNPPRDAELHRSLSLDDALVLGFAGSFYSYEGLDLLIRALPLMRDAARPVKVLLVGGGPEEVRLKDLAAQLGVMELLRFVGRVPHADMPRYYSLIDVLVYPRLCHRLTDLVTPLKPLEAMAQGKLVAASDVGGHRELIRGGETGFLFVPESSQALANCVARISAADTQQLDAMRTAARLFVERERTWRRSVSCYEPVYARLSTALSSGHASGRAIR